VKKRPPPADLPIRAAARGITKKLPVANTCLWAACPEPHGQRQSGWPLFLSHPEDHGHPIARCNVDWHPVRRFLLPGTFLTQRSMLSMSEREVMGKACTTWATLNPAQTAASRLVGNSAGSYFSRFRMVEKTANMNEPAKVAAPTSNMICRNDSISFG
jgi:hypothetical protein